MKKVKIKIAPSNPKVKRNHRFFSYVKINNGVWKMLIFNLKAQEFETVNIDYAKPKKVKK